MGRYPGEINTDVYGVQVSEMKPALLEYSATEAGDADTDGLLDASPTSTTEVSVATTFLGQPPSTRGITFTPSASADAGNIVVVGTNIAGQVITDTIATSTTNAVSSAKMFKTVTSVTFPIDDGSITWDAGWDERIGLPFKLSKKAAILEVFNGAMQYTAGTLATDDDEIEKNYFDPNGNLDGAKELKLLLFL